MPHLDLAGFLADDALTLTGVVSEKHPAGKSYTLPSPSAKFGLQLERVMQLWGNRTAPPTADDITELAGLVTDTDGGTIDIRERLLGKAYQQMLDDGVSADRMAKIVTVVIAHYGIGAEVARELAAAGEAGARANRATRRTPKKTAGSNSSPASSGTPARTRGRGSTRSSTSPTGPEDAQAV